MPGIKKITIPNDITIINPLTKEKQHDWKFLEFCHLFLNNDYFKESIENLRTALFLSEAIRNAPPGSEVPINADDLTKFVGVVSENFTKIINMNPIFLMQLLPFLDALTTCEESK